jgi:hypoxanthine phosphoribosyltransferase
MRRHIDRVLLDRRTIAHRVEELADQIAGDFTGAVGEAALDRSEPAALTLVPLMSGSVIFLADLMRCLPLMMRVRLISVQAYPDKSTHNQGVQVAEASFEDLAGTHILLVDDVLDSGRTLQTVRERVARCRPASVRACVLLRKQRPVAMDVPVNYVGFDIPDEFVVGYGLDYDGYYRNLPEVVTLTEEAMR